MKVSIIVPAYNASLYIDRCINSIINQSIKDIEIIVVNDGSNDDTLDKLKKYNNIILIDQKNSGISVSRNKALDLAKGEFILFIDSDDYIENDYIEKLLKIQKEKDYDIVETPLLFEAIINKKNKYYKEYNFKEYENMEFYKDFNSKNNLRYVIGVLYKRSVISNIRFDNDIRCYEDGIFNLRVKLNSHKYRFYNEPLYHYVQNLNSISKTISDKHLDYIIVMDKISKLYNKPDSNDYIENIFKNNVISLILFKLPYFKDNKYKYKKELLLNFKKYAPKWCKKHKIKLFILNGKILINLYYLIIKPININKIIFKIQSKNKVDIKK